MKSVVGAIKGWWEKAPQDKKDTVDDMITALKIPTKPKGKEWSDIEAWWNHLSDEEKEEVWRNFWAFPSTGSDRWTLEDVNEIMKWDRRIKVIDQFPMFKNISRELSLIADVQRFMDYSDKSRRSNIFHLRV